ncbi:MAG: hypothetical protein PVG33_02610 [Chloroflexota bacterium]|jgi:hypothetical protein
MNNEVGAHNSLTEMCDDLELIEGIGPRYAKALHEAGIHRFTQFGSYNSAQVLHQEIFEKTGVNVSAERIENEKWIEQAAKIWQQLAGFTVFFEYYKSKSKNEFRWQIRTYHNESGNQEEFRDVNRHTWVDWIHRQVKEWNAENPELPQLEQPEPIIGTSEEKERVLDSAPSETELKILKFQVAKIEPLTANAPTRLLATVDFELTGTEAADLAKSHTPYRIEVFAVDLKRNARKLVAVEIGAMEPGKLRYTCERQFPVPIATGRHQMISTARVLPPGEATATREGRIIIVSP